MTRTHAAAILLVAGAAAALAPVAQAAPAPPPRPLADPNALGVYTFDADSGETATWTIAPCAIDEVHCVNISERDNPKRAPWSANAYWTVGSWILFVEQPDAILCQDGETAPGRNNYSWDATSLDGYASTINAGGACGSDAGSTIAIPFTLTKTGELPRPPEAPIDIEPYIVDIPEPYVPPAEGAPPPGGALPAETDPAIVATPNQIPNLSDPLTEAIVAEPGFNADGGGRR